MLFDFISLERAPGFVRLAIFSLERQTPWEAASSLGELEDHLLRAAGKALKSGNRTHPKEPLEPRAHGWAGESRGDAAAGKVLMDVAFQVENRRKSII